MATKITSEIRTTEKMATEKWQRKIVLPENWATGKNKQRKISG